jgi:IMP dehydrogenase
MDTLHLDSETILRGLLDEDGFALSAALVDASEIMTRKVVSVDLRQSIGDAMTLFDQGESRDLPVTDGPLFAGTVSERGALRALLRTEAARALPVGTIMTKQPVTLAPWASISVAIDRLRAAKSDWLPVIDADRRLAGIVTATAVLQAQFALQRWIETRAPRLHS